MHIALDTIWPRAVGEPVPLLPTDRLITPWVTLTAVELLPGAAGGIADTARCEVAYVLLAGELEWRGPGGPFQLASPGVLVGGGTSEPPWRNPGPGPARYLAAPVAMASPSAPRPVVAQAVDAAALEWRPAIHGGVGRLATRHLWGPQDFASAWTFIDHAVLGTDASVGYHCHDALEEVFVVLAGCGLTTIADRTFEVGPGSVTYQAIGAGHGIYNPGPEDLAFLRLAVARPDETFTTVDLHDDLRARRPGTGRPWAGKRGT